MRGAVFANFDISHWQAGFRRCKWVAAGDPGNTSDQSGGVAGRSKAGWRLGVQVAKVGGSWGGGVAASRSWGGGWGVQTERRVLRNGAGLIRSTVSRFRISCFLADMSAVYACRCRLSSKQYHTSIVNVLWVWYPDSLDQRPAVKPRVKRSLFVCIS